MESCDLSWWLTNGVSLRDLFTFRITLNCSQTAAVRSGSRDMSCSVDKRFRPTVRSISSYSFMSWMSVVFLINQAKLWRMQPCQNQHQIVLLLRQGHVDHWALQCSQGAFTGRMNPLFFLGFFFNEIDRTVCDITHSSLRVGFFLRCYWTSGSETLAPGLGNSKVIRF